MSSHKLISGIKAINIYPTNIATNKGASDAGGGLLLLVVMACVLPMSVVIPVHGLVQSGSNAKRMMLTYFSFWRWLPLIIAIIISGAIGIWLGIKLLHRLPADKFKLVFRVILSL